MIACATFAKPSFDLSVLTHGLSDLDSYQAVITVGGTEVYRGTTVNKPAVARDLTISGTRIVTIGDQAWVAQPGGKLMSVPETMATGLFAAYDPSLMVGAFASIAWSQNSSDQGVEQKNGVSAHHYHVDSTTIQGRAAAAAFCRTCSGLRAPGITVVTPGCWMIQRSAA